jgi:hypothetical protein
MLVDAFSNNSTDVKELSGVLAFSVIFFYDFVVEDILSRIKLN